MKIEHNTSSIASLPLVSICIPTYNGEKYLEETLHCAINQTYKNIEIIICDDQSKDNTISICKDFALKDDRIKIFKNNKNLGLLGNWCQTVDQTSKDSEWIKFLFQDDLMDINTVEKMVTSAILTNVDFVLTNREYTFEKNVSKQIKKEYASVTKTGDIFKESKKYTPEETVNLIKNVFFHNCLGEPPCILFKKDMYNHSDYPSEFIQLIDYVFILKKIINSPFYFINENLVKFRVHNSSQSAKNTKDKSMSPETIYKNVHVHYYEKIKLCHYILDNPTYITLQAKIGKKSATLISEYLVYKSFYKHPKNTKEVASFYKSTELGSSIYNKNTTKYIYLKYKILKMRATSLRKKYRI
jgi:glycosyltransferase involved in cell wall biosynthesis